MYLPYGHTTIDATPIPEHINLPTNLKFKNLIYWTNVVEGGKLTGKCGEIDAGG